MIDLVTDRARCRRSARRLRSTSSPASRNGARWRRSCGRQGEHLRRDDGAAGPAPHRSAPEPDRAGAQRRPRWCAPAPSWRSAGCRWCRRSRAIARIQAGQPGFFEAARYVTLLEEPAAARSRAGRRARGRQSAHPSRSAQHRRSRGGARRAHGAARSGRSGPLPRTRARRSSTRWQQASARWEKQAAPLKGMAVVVYHTGT